jgi:hypothetical protein
MEMKLMQSSSPTRKLELQIKKAVAKEMICKSKVNRENKGVQTIKMKLDLLKESRECLDARFEIPEKFRSKFQFRAIFRDFWFRSRRNHFFRYRFLPDFLIRETEMRHRCDIDATVVLSIT